MKKDKTLYLEHSNKNKKGKLKQNQNLLLLSIEGCM